jgi:tripartite ATP-independent transporter DctP family solute receptor
MLRTFCSAIAAFFLSASVLAAPQITLKLGHIADPANPYGQGATKLAELVKQKTGGGVEIQVFPSSQLGNQRDLIEGLTLGTLDMTLTSTAVLGNFIQEMGVFDLPFLFRDIPHAYKTLDTIGMELAGNGEAKGLKTLAMMENGVRHMTNNRQPIRVPADMKGLKVRVMEQPVYIEMIKSLGGSPTPMAFGEIYTALQKGVIDAEENPLGQIVTARFFEVQKYVSLTAHTYSAEPVLISTSSWKKLPPSSKRPCKKRPRKPPPGSVTSAASWKTNTSSRSTPQARALSTATSTSRLLPRPQRERGSSSPTRRRMARLLSTESSK